MDDFPSQNKLTINHTFKTHKKLGRYFRNNTKTLGKVIEFQSSLPLLITKLKCTHVELKIILLAIHKNFNKLMRSAGSST